jgi:hypothetical protein
MGFNKKFFTTGGIVASSPSAPAALDPLQSFETVTYTGNGGTQKVTGYIRKGAAFNGSSSYIAASTNTIFDWGTKSVSLWINISSLGTGSKGILNKSDQYAPYGWFLYKDGTDNKIAFVQYDSGGNGNVLKWSTVPTLNTWYHICVTGDGTTNKMYVNGSLVDSAAAVTATTNSDPFTIGRFYSDYNDYYINGKIDQVRFFNTALLKDNNGVDEIQQLADEEYGDAENSVTDFFGNGTGVALYELDEDANDTGAYPYGTGDIDSGQSASLNGSSSKIDFTGPLTGITNNFSYSFWANSTTSSTNFIGIASNISSGTNRILFNFNEGGFYFFDFGNIASGGRISGSTPASWFDGNWHHFVIVKTPTSQLIYVDGAEFRNVTGQNSSVSGLTDFTIGNYTSNYTSGKIDQVRVYSTALSPSDVEALVSETNVPTSNLVAHYKLDGNANDETTNYNGTWSGTEAYSDPAEFPLIKYNGTPTNVNFLGMAFQPDFVWIKARSGTYGSNPHRIQDSVRGDFYLSSSSTAAEAAVTTGVQSYDTNGFTVGSGNSYNGSSTDYVAWCWKAGGNSNTYNVDDTGYSTASDAGLSSANGTTLNGASVNTQAGFSIINYETNVNGDNRPAHGLTQEPELIIFKPYDTSSLNWYVMTKKIDGSLDFLFLNTTDAKIDAGTNEFIDSTHFRTSFGTVWGSIIAYCFHSVDGYQRVSTYLGSGISGKRVYTTDDGTSTGNGGFRPRFLLIKNSENSTNSWLMYDSVRGDAVLTSDGSFAESAFGTSYTIDFEDNGFSIVDSVNANNELNKKIIYLAIA